MEQKNQLQASTKLEMQSRKQKVNSLIKYVKNEDEKQIVQALDDVKIKEITREDADRLIEVVGKWGFYMGSSARLSSDDILLLCKFLKDNYNFLTINEINLAISLNLKGALGKIEYYGNLSPLYMSQVLNAFLEYRKENLQPLLERKDRDDVKPTPQLNKGELVKMTQDALRLEYSKFIKGEVVDDLFSIVYTYLDKNNKLNLSDDSKRKAFAFSQKMLSNENTRQAKNIGDLIRNAVQKDDTIRFEKYFQNGILMDFFSKIESVDDLVNGVNINEIL
jgi:hypothetical protein